MRTLSSLLLLISPLLFSGLKSPLSTKSIEGKMVEIKDGFYVNKYETTNAEYREFVEWLKVHGSPKDQKISKVDHSGWKTIGYLPEIENHYFENQAFGNFPVVNISYEGAVKFCEWLTQKYNTSKMRKYEKLLFRLPTEQEWISMAKAGREMSPYPWGGPYLTTSKGRFLANFYRIGNSMIKVDIENRQSVEIQGIESSKIHMMTNSVNQFSQGPFELYNLSGNAAEMMAEKGTTKGGSYGSSGYYLRIDAEDEFEGFTTSPYVGFRYVMEVVEK